jgi:hypothetical protein
MVLSSNLARHSFERGALLVVRMTQSSRLEGHSFERSLHPPIPRGQEPDLLHEQDRPRRAVQKRAGLRVTSGLHILATWFCHHDAVLAPVARHATGRDRASRRGDGEETASVNSAST